MLFGLEGILAGQATLERGLITAGSAAGAASSRGVAKSVSGIMGSLEKALKSGQDASNSGSPGAARVSQPSQPAETGTAIVVTHAEIAEVPARTYEDPKGIQTGMADEELVRRFGPPSLEVTGASSARLLTYSGKNGLFQLELRNQKVTRVTAMTPQQVAVILP